MKHGVDSFMRRVLRTTALKRRAFFLLADSLLIVFSIYASFWFRFDGDIPAKYIENFLYYIPLFLITKLSLLMICGMYNTSWRFFGFRELPKLLAAITGASVLMGIFFFFFKTYAPFQGFPRSVLVVDYLFTMGFIGSLRISKRVVKDYFSKAGCMKRGRTEILIIGAGSAGEQIGREMFDNNKSKYFPVGYIDDDRAKKGLNINGIKVLGTREDIPAVLKKNGIDEVLVAIPSVRSKDIRQIVEIIRDSGKEKKIKILPGIMDLLDGKVTLTDIQEIQAEDLLGREPVEIDYAAIRGFLSGKRVLITGAGGSVGAELAWTVSQFEPAKLILIDIDETGLFYVVNRLKSKPTELIPVVGDIRDGAKMEAVFRKYRPEIILHAAAYKHVPILEYYPEEAIKTNILGTRNLGELALKFNVERFVNISTDKAINPTSVMGSSKRVAEEYLRILDRRNETRFVSVRFGNVAGSRGSVIPVFKEQIKKGGPVTVTHPEMKRYFMAVSEAVQLVLEAAAMGKGGEAYVLEMGEPVKILDLARDMIRLSGHEPDVDIPIIYTGLRAGEKFFEEILEAEEGSEPTEHAKIFRARSTKQRDEMDLREKVERLIKLSEGIGNREEIVQVLAEIVPTYKPANAEVCICQW